MNQNNELVLVVGATGTIGYEVCQSLNKAGIPFRATYHSESGKQKLDRLNLKEVMQLEMGDTSSLDAAFRGVKKAFLLVPDRPDMVELGYSLIDAAKRANVEYIVRSSAMGASEDTTLMYAQWHGKIDARLKETGIEYTLLLPSYFMQNYITFDREQIAVQNGIYLPFGDGKISYIDVRDIAAVATKCFLESSKHKGKSYTLTGREALSGAEQATIFSRHLDRQITYHDIPPEKEEEAMLAMGMPEILVTALSQLHSFCKANEFDEVSSDVETVLDRQPISFDRFVKDYKTSWVYWGE